MNDPALDPSVLDKLYHSGAYLPLGIVLVFLGLTWGSKHIAWLQAPNRVHYVSAGITGLAMLVGPATQGTTPNLSMMIAALGTVIALVLPGATPKGETPQPVAIDLSNKPPQAGFARLGVMIAIVAIGGALLFGCSKNVARDTIKAAVVSADTAKAALPVYAHKHVEAIIADSHDDATMRANVAAFDAKVDKVQQDIAAVWRLAALAGVNLDDPSMANLAAAGTELHNDLKLIGLTP